MQAGALTGARLHACVLMKERKQRKNPEKKLRFSPQDLPSRILPYPKVVKGEGKAEGKTKKFFLN